MRIGLVGTHGVGKSTLVTALLKNLITYKTYSENSRRVLKKGCGLNFKTTKETQLEFLHQYKNMFRRKKPDNLITSRTLIDLYAYTAYFYDEGNYGIDSKLLNRIELYTIKHLNWWDFFVYVSIEFPIIKENEYREGQKSHPIYQQKIDEYIQQFFRMHKVSWVKVSGSIENRVNQVLCRLE